MPPSALPANDSARLAALDSYGILDTPPEPVFDRLTALAAHILGVPIALISLVDERREPSDDRWAHVDVTFIVKVCRNAVVGSRVSPPGMLIL